MYVGKEGNAGKYGIAGNPGKCPDRSVIVPNFVEMCPSRFSLSLKCIPKEVWSSQTSLHGVSFVLFLRPNRCLAVPNIVESSVFTSCPILKPIPSFVIQVNRLVQVIEVSGVMQVSKVMQVIQVSGVMQVNRVSKVMHVSRLMYSVGI